MKKRALIIFAVVCFCTLLGGCKSGDYKTANAYLESGEFEKAIELFSELGDYNESAQLLILAENSLDYQTANGALEDGEYKQAIEIFEKLGDFKDSSILLQQAEHEKLAYDVCVKLRKMCKDPSSFMLYDDVYINEEQNEEDDQTEESGKTIVYVSYGAKNSYGTMLTGFAFFDGMSYVGDWYDTEDDFGSQSAYDTFLLDYKFAIAWRNAYSEVGLVDEESEDDSYGGYIKVSGEKLAELLDADFSYITGIRDLR